ncbi:MAG: hypothetical protein E7049_06590 [Lentisphaerae bacterium]|nr:hypothetical protein [Lentisphaerota bacterium]
MKCVLTLLFTAFAASAFALPRMKISDVLAMEADEIAACGKCELEVQVAFKIPWEDDAFVATDVDDMDGHALYFASFSDPPSCMLDGIGPGDILNVTGTLDPMLLEPGVALESVKLVAHADLPPPRMRSVLEIKAGHFNNRRVRVRGVGVSAMHGKAAGKPAFLLCLLTSDGEIRVRVRNDGLQPAAFRDAEVEVDGVVVPMFNPRHEFIGAEIEALDAKSLKVVKAPPEDPFSVPECDARSLLAWNPRGRRLHACRVMGEVTCVYEEDGAFTVQRGKTSVRAFAENSLPAVGVMVEAVGFPSSRDECSALVGALWRRTDEHVEPAEINRLSLSGGAGLDADGFIDDNDLQFRLVEVDGRVVGVNAEQGPRGRIIVDVDGNRVDVMLPSSGADGLPRGIEDRPRVRVRGVLDAHVSFGGGASDRLFSFKGLRLQTRSADDIVIVPDWQWVARRTLGFAWIAFLSAIAALCIFAAVVVFRRHHARIRAKAIAADRRRIAAELHDTISQHISGARLWVYSAKTAAGDTLAPAAAGALVMAENVLEATRREIRDAIMDLQSDEFISQSPESLLRRICRDASVPGKTRVRSFLSGLPADLPIRVKRDLLAIASEAIGNAVRHGGAKNVIVVSEGDDAGAFTLRVLNDGEPFSVDAAPGPEEGHFGISNMRERAMRSGMSLTFGENRGYVAVILERPARA